MTQSRLAALAVVLFCAPFPASGEDFPQNATVGPDGATVRSGPGEAFYATDELAAGSTVEIWQRGTSGWLAIRPPESSFSLVPAASLLRTAGSNVAEVAGTDVVAWIGSNRDHTGDHKWQVQLEAGERVVVLGTVQLRLHEAAAEAKVARIKPPAGEFRWIRDRDLEKKSPTQSPPVAESPIRLADHQVPAATAEDEVNKLPAADGFVARKGPSTGARTADRATRTTAASARGTEPAFEEALRNTELRLSLMAAQPASRWDFESLRDEAQALVERGESTLDRARAQRLLDQVEDFDSLKRRFVLLHGEQATEDPATPSQGNDADAEPLVAPRFDATGWLFPVYSRERVAPPYALLDDEGRIVQFISPAPGLNLHRYLRKQIGVYGEKSIAPNVNKPHVVAHRVVDLERHRR